MVDRADLDERFRVFKVFDDRFVEVEDVLPFPESQAFDIAGRIDVREKPETFFLPDLIVILPICRSDVDDARTGFGGDVVAGDDAVGVAAEFPIILSTPFQRNRFLSHVL